MAIREPAGGGAEGLEPGQSEANRNKRCLSEGVAPTSTLSHTVVCKMPSQDKDSRTRLARAGSSEESRRTGLAVLKALMTIMTAEHVHDTDELALYDSASLTAEG